MDVSLTTGAKYGLTLLTYVAAWSRPEATAVVRLLLAARADPNYRVAVEGRWKGETPLGSAARRSRTTNLRILLNAGADPTRPG